MPCTYPVPLTSDARACLPLVVPKQRALPKAMKPMAMSLHPDRPGTDCSALLRDRRSRWQSVSKLIVVVTICLALASCGSNASGSDTGGQPTLMTQLTTNGWTFAPGSSSVRIATTRPITLSFRADENRGRGRSNDSGVLSGATDCNGYSATFVLASSTITVGPINRTPGSCAALAGVGSDQYLSALQMVSHVEPTSHDGLELTNGSSTKLVYFASSSTSSTG